MDWLSVLLYALLVSVGWISIYAADFDGLRTGMFDLSTSHGKQILWVTVALVLAILIVIIDNKFYTTFAYLIYGLVMVMLVMIFFIGSEVKGNKSWFVLGGFSIQPSEFAKFATALAVAKFLSSQGANMKYWSTRFIVAAIILLPMILILYQGDAGSALVFLSFVLVLYREGLSSWVLVGGGLIVTLSLLALVVEEKLYLVVGIVLITAIIIYFLRKHIRIAFLVAGIALASMGYIYGVSYLFAKLKPHQKDRIEVVLGKLEDKKGAGYNLDQSKIAIGSGGFSGKGFLNGTQTKGNFVPEQTTDFIFCTVGEEHGFIGTMIVLGLFMALLARIIYISERQRSKFTRLYGYGVASIIFFHVIINIGMTIGLVPVIGIPLPFLSYGGSSILSFTILLFILLKLDSDRLAVLR
jgi:rod shape determining protein RodA